MTEASLRHHRLFNQGIDPPRHESPLEAVERLGALQSQDYAGARWSIGLRVPGCTVDDVEYTLSERSIVRSWPLRGTLHIVAAADLRWMLALTAGRVIERGASRYRQLELDDDVFERCRQVLTAAMRGGKGLLRGEVNETLSNAGIRPDGQRSYHILHRLGLERKICFGTLRGKQHTFVLLDEWIPATPEKTRDEALAELARRYFTGHGPATLHDFVWWSGLTVSEARAGMSAVASELVEETVGAKRYLTPASSAPVTGRKPAVQLLPGFDEYLLGYTDRSAALRSEHTKQLVGSNGLFRPTVMVNGRVAGLWTARARKGTVEITPTTFRPMTKSEEEAVVAAAVRYGRFLRCEARLVP